MIAAVVFAVVAVFLPTHWYETIPRPPDHVLPFNGLTLLRTTFVIESLILLVLGLRGFRVPDLRYDERTLIGSRRSESFDISSRAAWAIVAAATVVGLALRIYRLDQDLWLDEIGPLMDYMKLGPLQILGSYLRPNNHFLNTILMKVSVQALGEHEWSVRIPAMIAGVLCIPATYILGRVAMSRAASAGAAIVLALSYHHIFFSQNARGYTAYILFALLSTALLIEALRRGKQSLWILYVVTAVLGAASLLIMGFVIAAHVAICIAIAFRIRRADRPVAPFITRMFVVFAVVGLVSLQIYAAALPEALVVLNSAYDGPATGFAAFSPEFFAEMLRGVGAAFSSPAIAITFLAIAAGGFAALFFLRWPVALALFLPPFLTAMSLALRGETFSPRFFLLLLLLAILSAAAAVQILASFAAARLRLSGRAASGVVLACLAIMGVAAGRSLPYYYRTPKQPYRGALAFATSRDGQGRIVVMSNAAGGFRYYSARLPEIERARIVYAANLAAFDSLTHGDQGAPVQVLTTFSRALRIELPDVAKRLSSEWVADTTLASTVGDAEITVWSKRHPSVARDKNAATEPPR